MKNLLKSVTVLSLLFFTLTGLAQEREEGQLLETEFYNLYKPDSTKAVLVLFGGFPENAMNIEKGFPITKMALDSNVAVAYLNFNRKLWLEGSEKEQLASSIQQMINTNNLPSEKVYIGGMSSGGSIALLISDFLTENEEYLSPAGVFVVDSPIDLAALYRISEQNVENNFSEASKGESGFILNYFDSQLGDPDEEIGPYENYSVFTHETENFQNLENLKNTRLRFYTEPDTLWWKENMGVEYEQMNAFHLKRLSEFLTANNFEHIEYITTENKGYRADGTRHPHSWSIVDKEGLLQWILEE